MKTNKELSNYGFTIVELLILIVFVIGFAYIITNVYSYSRTTSGADIGEVAPSISLKVAPNTVSAEDATTISWTSSGTKKCYASDDWSGTLPISGSRKIGPYNDSTRTIHRYVLQCVGTRSVSTSAVLVVDPNEPAVSNCSNTTPSTTDPSYPLRASTIMNTDTLPSVLGNYGKGIMKPGGYIDGLPGAGHLVPTTNGLEINGFPDQVNYPGSSGVVGAGFDLDTLANKNYEVLNNGGFSVCFSMSPGVWQNSSGDPSVHLVILSWPLSGHQSDGEEDFFEGNPQAPGINIHEIGPAPSNNWESTFWPKGVSAGRPHEISIRWDPANGYRFWLDGVLQPSVTLLPSDQNSADCLKNDYLKCVTLPDSPHQLSIQMQDLKENSSANVSATIYWAATYGYGN